MTLLLTLWLACGGTDDPATTPPAPVPTTPTPTPPEPTAPVGVPAPEGVTVTQSDVIATVPFVRWTTAEPSTGHVRWTQGAGGRDRRTPSTPLGTEHEVAVLGLKAGHTVELVVVSDGEEPVESQGVTIPVPPPPPTLAPVTLVTADLERVSDPDAYVVANFRDGPSYVVILDMDGDVVWWVAAEPGQQVTTVKPAWDGGSLLWITHNSEDYLLPGGIHRLSLDGRDAAYTEARWAHHDFEPLPDGDLAWIAYTLQDDALLDGVELPVVADAIWEGPEGSVEGEHKVFDYLDDYPHPPTWVCDHLELGRYVDGYHEWTHSNSLMYDADRDRYLMMSKTLDTLIAVDRASGALQWTLGGPDSDLVFEADGPDALPFDHPHMSHVWDGGFAVFDNRVHTPPKVSRAAVYAVDEVAGTYRQVWSFPEPNGGFTGRLGDVRALDSGHYLTAWGGLGALREITADGEVVWHVRAPVNIGRVRWLPDLYALPASGRPR